MMVKPSVTELLKKAENRYELVIATSRRARQIVNQRLEDKEKASNDNNVQKVKEQSAVTEAATEIGEGLVEIVRAEEGE